MQIADLIRERGPMTVAAFMDLALYDPQFGYYARRSRRSGRTGDFFTSVDVGAIFGELLEIQLAEMCAILGAITAEDAKGAKETHTTSASSAVKPFDLVEAGAGNGRLSADILRAAQRRDPACFERICLYLVEASAAARAEHPSTLGEVADRLVASTSSLPSSFEGVLIANELLDALPVHQVVMRADGLREVYVGACGPSELVLVEGPPSTPELATYLERLDVVLEPGWRVEINLRAVEWVRAAARRLRRGFMILIDYGHEARELYSASHATGTLTAFSGHTMAGPESATEWMQHPGEQDITAHVDFTSVRAAAEKEGLTTLGFLDQTYFLLGLLTKRGRESFSIALDEKDSRPLKTLIMPGGLGSTHKVLILGTGVGTPSLAGCSYRRRVT